jgi:hypothetical protein
MKKLLAGTLWATITITIPDAKEQIVLQGFQCETSPTPRACVKAQLIEIIRQTVKNQIRDSGIRNADNDGKSAYDNLSDIN